MPELIYPVILCGGAGTRLWPLSRKAYPKQFTSIIDAERSLFEETVALFRGAEFAAPTVVTGSDFRFIVAEQLARSGTVDALVMIEPEARNTAPAVLAAALHIYQKEPGAVVLVAPSDHVITDHEVFRAAVLSGLPAVDAGQIVTFGITPTAPETGYGWLELGDGDGDGDGVVPLKRFVEKPNLAVAQEMMVKGGFLWNAGIFMFKAAVIIKAFETYASEMVAPVSQSLAQAEVDLDFLRLAPGPWADAPSQSIDYAVMEHAPNLSVVPYSAGWNDLGSWSAVKSEFPSDENGVSTFGAATAIDCKETLLRADSPGLELVGIGLKNIIAVAMSDAVLVVDAERTQDVKKAVDILRARKAVQAENFRHDHRPWGHFETLSMGERFQVKRIVVKPGAALSLQSHMHRSEHWIVVSGTARVTIDEEVRLVTENQSIYIPLGAKHRMENPGKVPMVLIEVQTGTYLGEDDIIRYEDIYARGQGAKG